MREAPPARVSWVRAEDLAPVEEWLHALVGGFDPDAVAIFESPDLFAALDRLERLISAAKTLLARRVADSCTWPRAGYRSAADQLAGLSDSSVNSAHTMLETSRNLEDLPATAAALRSGTLSRAMAEVVAAAATVAPDAEAALLASAATTSLAQVRKECSRVKGKDVDAAHRRIHRERSARMYTDDEGAWHLYARGTVDAGLAFKTELNRRIDARFKATTDPDSRESREAYAFDALMDMARDAAGGGGGGTPEKAAPRNVGIIRVDHTALVRGWVEGDEVCEIAGLGPIPVKVARRLLGDSILKLVITKGVDVANVTHLGRGVTAAQQAALRWLMAECTRLGCTRTERLENDHRRQWIKVHETKLGNIDPLCDHDHDLKTYFGWALVAGEGKREMVPPDDPRHPNYRAPPEAI